MQTDSELIIPIGVDVNKKAPWPNHAKCNQENWAASNIDLDGILWGPDILVKQSE